MASLLHHLDLQGPVLEGPSTIDRPPDATRREPRSRPARHRRRSPRRRLDRGCRSCRRPPPGPPAPGQEAGIRRRLPARPPRAAGRRNEVLNGPSFFAQVVDASGMRRNRETSDRAAGYVGRNPVSSWIDEDPGGAGKKMRLMIQIPAFLEILISCFLRSNEVGFSQWASRPGGAPRNRSPSGWRTEGKLTGLVEGMPDVSPTWSPGRTDFAKGRTQRPGLRAG